MSEPKHIETPEQLQRAKQDIEYFRAALLELRQLSEVKQHTDVDDLEDALSGLSRAQQDIMDALDEQGDGEEDNR